MLYGELAIWDIPQTEQLPEMKELRPELNDIRSQVLQDVLHRVDKAMKAVLGPLVAAMVLTSMTMVRRTRRETARSKGKTTINATVGAAARC